MHQCVVEAGDELGCSASKSSKDAFCDQHSDEAYEEVDVDPLGYIKANVLDTMISRASSTEERTVLEAKRKAEYNKMKAKIGSGPGGGGGGGAPSQSKAPAGHARAYQNQLAITKQEHRPQSKAPAGRAREYTNQLAITKQEQRHWTITLLRCGNFAVCQKVETKHGEFSLCSACQIVPYCSGDCQTAHWQKHKVMCKELKEE
eukprot:gene16494-23998_t